MSKLLSLYKLCPNNNNEILGVSADAERSSVICTLGKKIVNVIELSTQKQIKSWSTLENFTAKVVYDFKRKQYVGVFSNIYIRFWDIDTEDINKTKKIKLHKRIHELLNISKDRVLVVYENGSTELLDCALESRKTYKKDQRQDQKVDFSIENTQMGNEIFSFVKKVDNVKIFCYTMLDDVSLEPIQNYNTITLERPGQNVQLMGFTTIYSNDGLSHLITIWSDKRIFKQKLKLDDNDHSVGVLHSMIEPINVRNQIAVRAISENCIAIYASKQNDDGSNIILYNIKYKVIQSILPFKVYLSNFKLWSVNENLYLSMGQHLSVVPFVVSEDKLSSMVGSQIDAMESSVEKEMINEDAFYEEALEFDEDQDAVEGMEFIPNEIFAIPKPKLQSRAKIAFDSDELRDTLNELCRGDLMVDIVKLDDQPDNSSSAKLLNNVDESFPLMSENFEFYCMNLEHYGCSEIEITTKVVPILLKTNRTEDLGLLLKRYNHVSERMLVQIIKYLLTCPFDDTSKNSMEIDNLNANDEINLNKNGLCAEEKRFKNANVFLNTEQNQVRDVLSITLCCAFDSTTILKYLNSDITLNEMIQLMDHLYKILTTNALDDTYDMRGNLVEGDDFDLDKKLFEWFTLLLDSHYQQILLSKDDVIKEKMDMWMALIDEHVRILSEMKDMRNTLFKIANNKPVHLSQKCSQWYTIEKLELY